MISERLSQGALGRTGIVIAGQVVSLLATLLLTPIQLAGMGTDGYGLLSLAVASAAVLSFVDYGLGWSALYYLPRVAPSGGGRSTLTRLWRWGLILAIPTGTVAVAVLALSSRDSDVRLLILTGVVAACTLLANFLYSAVRALNNFVLPTALATFTAVGTNVFWAVVASHPGAVELVLGWMIANSLLVIGVQGVYTWRVTRGEVGTSPPVKEMRSSIAKASLFGLAGALLASGDKVIVGATLGPSDLAFYSIAVSLASRVTILTSSAVSVLLPQWSGSHHSEGNATMTRSMERILPFTAAITAIVSATVALAGPAFVSLWISAEFSSEIAPAIACLAIGFGAYGIGALGYAGNDARGGISKSTYVSLPIAVATLLAVFPAAAWAGVTGAAIAFSVGISIHGLAGLRLAGAQKYLLSWASLGAVLAPFAFGAVALLVSLPLNSPLATLVAVCAAQGVLLLRLARVLRSST